MAKRILSCLLIPVCIGPREQWPHTSEGIQLSRAAVKQRLDSYHPAGSDSGNHREQLRCTLHRHNPILYLWLSLIFFADSPVPFFLDSLLHSHQTDSPLLKLHIIWGSGPGILPAFTTSCGWRFPHYKDLHVVWAACSVSCRLTLYSSVFPVTDWINLM